jgi:hypothetical protein
MTTEFTPYSKIKLITDQFPSLLLDYKKYYVLANLYPDIAEYQQFLDGIEQDIQTKLNTAKSIVRETELQTIAINQSVIQLKAGIDKQKSLHTTFTNQLNQLSDERLGSQTMNSDKKLMYGKQWWFNAEMLVGLFLVGKVLLNTP